LRIVCRNLIHAISSIAICVLLAQAAAADDVVSGNFELIDHNGDAVTEHSYDGHLRLVFFGFTQCPDVCPTTMMEIRAALKLLGEDAVQIQPLFISIDRKNDTTERVADYVAAFGPTFIGLTGSEQQTRAAASAFNVTYGTQEGEQSVTGNDTIFHSAYLFLMGRDGKFLNIFGYGTKADIIAIRISEYL
jgi:cytochrome oxidase Cu insertion factor (SCO1/SenC/PrrC family)